MSMAQAALYLAGRTIADQNISVKPWGSGSIAESDEIALEGTKSLRVSTRNYFQGGRLIFGTPVDWATAFADKNNLLLIQFRVADGSMTMGGNPPSGGGGGGELGGNPQGGGGGRSGGGRGLGAQGGTAAGETSGVGGVAGGGGGAAGTPGAIAPIRTLRLVVSTTDGKKSEIYIPITTGTSPGVRGWRSVGIPLQAIRGFDASNKTIKEVALSADSVGTFFIGEMKVLNDTTPIYGQANHSDLNLALGDEVEFIGRGTGGASVLRYTWDFDSADGVQVDAEGQSVKRRFRKPGVYTVTMTISDAYGLKAPYTSTIKVNVNP